MSEFSRFTQLKDTVINSAPVAGRVTGALLLGAAAAEAFNHAAAPSVEAARVNCRVESDIYGQARGTNVVVYKETPNQQNRPLLARAALDNNGRAHFAVETPCTDSQNELTRVWFGLESESPAAMRPTNIRHGEVRTVDTANLAPEGKYARSAAPETKPAAPVAAPETRSNQQSVIIARPQEPLMPCENAGDWQEMCETGKGLLIGLRNRLAALGDRITHPQRLDVTALVGLGIGLAGLAGATWTVRFVRRQVRRMFGAL